MLLIKNTRLTAFLIVAMSLAPALAVPSRSLDIDEYAPLKDTAADQVIALDTTRANVLDDLHEDSSNWGELGAFADENSLEGQDTVDEDPSNWEDIDMFNIQDTAQMAYSPAVATNKVYEVNEYDYEQDIFGHLVRHLIRHGHRIMRHVIRHAPRLIRHLKKHVVRHGGRVFKHIKKHLVRHVKKIFKKLGGSESESSGEGGVFEMPKFEPKRPGGMKSIRRPSIRPRVRPTSGAKGGRRFQVGRSKKGRRVYVDSEEEYSSALAHEIIMAILNIENAGPEDGFVGLDAEDIGEFDHSADSDREFENLLLDFILNAE